MKVNLICPGKSLDLWGDALPAASSSIAINIAINRFKADWWVFIDGWWPQRAKGRPKKGIVTQDTFFGRQKAGKYNEDFSRIKLVNVKAYRKWRKVHHSSEMALWWAGTIKGITELHIYGMDMAGNEYAEEWDRLYLPTWWHNADDKRWPHEAKGVLAEMKKLWDNGIEIHWHRDKDLTWKRDKIELFLTQIIK